ncbi:MAG: deoxyribose-phosphate aldolase [Longimicrobiales bacterium]
MNEVGSNRTLLRNRGAPLDLAQIRNLRIEAATVKEKVARLELLRPPRGRRGIRAFLKILNAIDLTSLASDDTVASVRRLCRTARTPLPIDLRKKLDLRTESTRVGAVCVFPVFVPHALGFLEGTRIPVATVSAGFPHGLSSLSQRIREVGAAAEAGAQEIDVVIRREWALQGRWEELFREVRAFREAAGKAQLKVILGTGDLADLNRVARAALTSVMAGADFVKTSTGKEKVNAALPAGMAIAKAIRSYHRNTGFKVGLKPAGGIRLAREGFRWLRLVESELGEEWTEPRLFRIGASSLLDDVAGALGRAVGI